jgi:hypothetical protein
MKGMANSLAEPSGSDPQRFLQYYLEELKDQFRGTTKK